MDFPDFLKLMNAVPLTEEEVLCSSNIATIATNTYHAHPCTYMSYICNIFPGPAICCEHGLGCLDSVAFFVAPRLKCIFEQI